MVTEDISPIRLLGRFDVSPYAQRKPVILNRMPVPL